MTRSFLALLLGAVAIACSANTGEGSSAGAPARPTTCMPDAPRYHAFLASGPCVDVEGAGGRWLSRSLFPEAPTEIRDTACTYRWAAFESSTRAPHDLAALEALGAKLLTKSTEKSPPCESTLTPGSAPLTPVPTQSGDAVPTGVTGCDVCAHVFEQDVFVILPAEDLELRTLVVPTSAGEWLSFEMNPPPGAEQVFKATLPLLSNEAAYRQGWVSLLERPF
jgi:hypothetical protein